MVYMKNHATRAVKGFYRDQDLLDKLAWTVHESPSLDGATKDEVRRRFRQWVQHTAKADPTEVPPDIALEAKEYMLLGHARMRYCIHVDAECLASIPGGDIATENITRLDAGVVNLIRADESWQCPDFDRFDWSTHVAPDPEAGEWETHWDEGEPEIEGSRLHDVGWMRVNIPALYPDIYSLLDEDHMWDVGYMRPPEITRH